MQAYLATFASTHAAMAFEASFGAGGALVPVPPTLRAGCGMAWRFAAAGDEAARGRAARAAAGADLRPADWELHAQEGGAWRPVAP